MPVSSPTLTGAAAATRAVRVIREGVKIIADHPASGRPIEDMDPPSVSGSSASATAATSCSIDWTATRRLSWPSDISARRDIEVPTGPRRTASSPAAPAGRIAIGKR